VESDNSNNPTNETPISDTMTLEILRKNLPQVPGIQGRDKYGNFVVLLPLVMIDGELNLLFEKRSADIRQGGEICFPGGRFDPDLDDSFSDTALRETFEELGIPRDRITLLGPLDTMVAPIGVLVESFIGLVNISGIDELVINPGEVSRVLLIPLKNFLQSPPEIYGARVMVHPTGGPTGEEVLFPAAELGVPEKYHQPWGGNLVRLYAFRHDDEIIWGITAELVMEVVKKLQGHGKSLLKLEDAVRQYVKSMFSDSRGSHDWDHTLRVKKMCDRIGAVENADMEVLTLSALLHDIGRHDEYTSRGKLCHAQTGAVKARTILEQFGAAEELIEKVVHCVSTHRFRGANPPLSLEARILFDADKLDSIGAVGIGRAFLFAGEVGARLHDPDPDTSRAAEYTREDTAYREFVVKLSRLKDRMTTHEGRKMAIERHDFMVAYFKRINNEVAGIC
jgi:uncharacterized protein